MIENPFKYKGPLEPETDCHICDCRENEVKRIIAGIVKGEYWAIMGTFQVGKTTLLNLIKKNYPEAYYIYMYLETQPRSEISFYKNLISHILAEVPVKNPVNIPEEDWWEMGAQFVFLDFLRKLQPAGSQKKIVFLLDEMDQLPYIGDFLSLWRQVYHEAYYKTDLKRYSVVITGTMELISLSRGRSTSPFNIAEKLFIKDFGKEESHKLLSETFGRFNIVLENDASELLYDWINGHPQLLQQAGALIFEQVQKNKKKTVSKIDVESAVNCLMLNNNCLDTLRQDIKENNELVKLLKSILNGKKRSYSRFKDLAFFGAGAIIASDSYCGFRNKLFEQVAREALKEKELDN